MARDRRHVDVRKFGGVLPIQAGNGKQTMQAGGGQARDYISHDIMSRGEGVTSVHRVWSKAEPV